MELENLFIENINTIIENIINTTKKILTEINADSSFKAWIEYSADWDLKYLYEIKFKEYFLTYFTIETERVLNYYSQNLCCAIEACNDSYNSIEFLLIFIEKYIINQFKNMDQFQLYLEND